MGEGGKKWQVKSSEKKYKNITGMGGGMRADVERGR